MERKITVGYWYIVGGPAGATVTVKGEENPCCTVPEGGQGCFFAQAPVVIVSDEAITLSQVVNFKCAPVKRWLLGLGRGVSSVLPRGYLAAEFILSTGTSFSVPTSFYENVGYYALYRPLEANNAHPFFAMRDFSGYWYAPTASSDFRWMLWLFEKKYYGNYAPGDLFEVYANYKNNREWSVKTDTETKTGSCADVTLPKTNHQVIFRNAFNVQFFRFTVTEYDKIIIDYIPAVTDKGKPCFFDKVGKVANLAWDSSKIVVGMNMKQALKLSALPAGGGALTVSLPWEAQLVQHNADVEAALQTAKSNGWTITVQHREPEADSAVYNKYAACTTFADMATVNLNWKQDITVDKSWLYPMPALVDSRNGDNLSKNMSQVPVEFFYLYWPNAKEVPYALKGNKTVKKVEWHTLNNTVYAMGFCIRCDNLEEVVGTCPKLYDLRSAMQGCKKLKKWGIALPYLHWGGGAFDGTILDKESALLILSSISIPTLMSTCNLTLGIHIDHQTDDEVLAAIADAEAKNWNLTVQWNGTPSAQSASTYGLRKPTIYAKLGTLERPDGTTEQVLDWGHYVTNAEENGYQEFATVEEAKEHFNIGD